ncbi:MAG TPA: glutathione S-transferase family protein [Woeseiaceae bacterium]|jgi:glutathione S-transferase|nr:glutathione S-transferase family protein [Woeseiaceae bacterium]
MTTLQLYHYEPSANSMKPLLCLAEKGLEYESHYVDLHNFEQHSEPFVALNPNGQVPVLVHDGAVITESTVINEYLDEVFPEVRLVPRDPVARARMRIWSKFVDEYFCPALSRIGWSVLIPKIAARLQSGELEEALKKVPLEEQRRKWLTAATESFTKEELADSHRQVCVSIERMEGILRDAKWLAGDDYSLADVNTYSMVAGTARLIPEAMPEEKTPNAVAWLQRMNERPAVKAALATSRLAGQGG